LIPLLSAFTPLTDSLNERLGRAVAWAVLPMVLMFG